MTKSYAGPSLVGPPCLPGKLEDEIIGLQSSLEVPGKEELKFCKCCLVHTLLSLKKKGWEEGGKRYFHLCLGYPGEHVYGITLSLTSTFHLLCWQFKDGRM